MIKGHFANKESLSIGKKHIYYKRDKQEIYVIGYIYNLHSNNIAKDILEGYETVGYKYFSTLDGSFTVIIYSPEITVIARDHHGINSQIYFTNNLFSSSLFELIQSEGVDRTPNYNSLAFFLTAGHIKAPESSFANISKLEAGHILIYNLREGIKTINLFLSEEVKPDIDKNRSIEEYADEFYKLHLKAIQRRINGNDKIGLFLSGGYDSGANLIALRELYTGDIDTYSIGFKGENISELPQARLMADTFGSIHKEYEIDGSEISSLPRLIRHFGDPFAECGMMVNYAVFGLSGDAYPGILLGGEGNDHYFSTANRQIAIHYLISRFGLIKALSLIKSHLDQDKFDKDGLLFRAKFHLETSLNIIQGEIFGFPRYQVPKLLRNESHLLPFVPITPNSDNYDSLYIQHILKTDIEKSLNRVILFKSSKIAEMFNSHISYPFVDLDIYHFMNNLPTNLKCKGENLLAIAMGKGIPKYLHKYVYAPKMPELIAQKEKQGGFVPMAIFFKNDIQRKKMAEAILDSSICEEFLEKKEVEHFLSDFNRDINQPVKWFWYRQIKCNQFFNLLTLSIWWEEYIKGRMVYL